MPNAGERVTKSRGAGMTTAKTKPLTAYDLLRLDSEGVQCDLIRGVLREYMPTGIDHDKIAAKLVILIGIFVLSRNLGTVTASDTGIWLERDPDTVRGTDVTYFSADKLSPNASVPGYSEVIPDLVAEVASPNDSLRDLGEKAEMWIERDVRLVWVAHPGPRTVDVYYPNGDVSTLMGSDTLDGAKALSGFSCRVGSIFEMSASGTAF